MKKKKKISRSHVSLFTETHEILKMRFKVLKKNGMYIAILHGKGLRRKGLRDLALIICRQRKLGLRVFSLTFIFCDIHSDNVNI